MLRPPDYTIAPFEHPPVHTGRQSALTHPPLPQVAALSKLVSLGSCSEAGMLGPSWLILLRTLSQLERLQASAGWEGRGAA